VFNVLTINQIENIWIPNTFTPDNDEHNQTFKPIISKGYDVNDYSFFIYNRWGEIIWESHDVSQGWDGTFNNVKCQDGVYTWSLSIGIKGNDGKINYNGYVILIK